MIRLSTWLGVALLAGVLDARASEVPWERPRRVVVLPVVDHAPDPDTVFRDRGTPPPTDMSAVVRSFGKVILGALRTVPRVEVVDFDVARERIRRSHSAREVVESAREDFERLNVEGAIGRIESALISLRLSYADVFERDDMSEVYEVLAQCYAERPPESGDGPQGDLDRARELLKTMFYFAPRRSFERGFYGAPFQAAIKEAFHDYRATYPKENPLGDQRRLDQFMEDLSVDTLVHAWIEEAPGDQRMLRVQIVDRTLATVTFATPLPTGRPAGRDARRRVLDPEARLDRFLSEWLACLPAVEVPGVRPEGPTQRFFIDTGFAYSIYGKDTTREPFHNLGMGLSAEYQFLAGLGAFLQVNMFTSTQDPQRDLVDSFTSVRTAFGLSYAFRGSWWRLSARFGFDVHVLGSYKTTTDPWCKWAGTADERCQDPDLTDLGNEVTMGFYGGLAAQFFATEHFFVSLRLTTASYILPLDQSVAVNFPVTTELSLGYGF